MKKTIFISFGLIVTILLTYLIGIGFYADKFHANTHFGMIDISQLTLEQAQERIQTQTNTMEISLIENGKEQGKITLNDIDPVIEIDAMLENVYESQNPNKWILNYFSSSDFQVDLNQYISIDERLLMNIIEDIDINNADRKISQDAQIKYNESQGFYVEPEVVGNQIDFLKLKELLIQAIQNNEMVVDFTQAYYRPEISHDDEMITAMMEAIDAFADTKINLEISEDIITIPRDEIMKWIYFNEQNQIVINEELVMDYLKTLNDKYATYNKPRMFESTLSGRVEVQPGTLGWSIDRESETQQIIEDLYESKEVTRLPNIVGTGYNQKDDIGNTYVEVDITHQTMIVYVDGSQVLSTPIVTGQIGTDTVPGAYSIWDKEENAILKGFNDHTGRDYEQPVRYWLPFDDTGQGIHDADWQPSFGGDTYLISGSLGCINTPPDIMQQVFDVVPVGTPVIIF